MSQIESRQQEENKNQFQTHEVGMKKKQGCDNSKDIKSEMWKFNQVNWPEELKKLTFKTKCIKIDQNLYDFLEEDGIYIHPRYQKNSSQSYLLEKNKQKEKKEGDDEDSFDAHFDSFDEKNHNFNEDDEVFKFRIFSPKFEKEMKDIFEEFQSVFVKLNWCAPRDTENWLHKLEITNLEDLLTVLKSSGILAELLDNYKDQFGLSSTAHIESQQEQAQSQQNTQDSKKGLYLIIKKWYNLQQHMMVRCFVRNKKLVSICQRHCSSVNSTLEEKGQLFSEKISNFYYNKIAPYFDSDNYVFDMFIDIAPNYKLKLVDINPWRGHTNPLLCDWEQLEQLDTNEFDKDKKLWLNFVRTESDVIIEDLSAYRVPEEMLFDGDDNDQNMANVFDYLNIHNKDLYQ